MSDTPPPIPSPKPMRAVGDMGIAIQVLVALILRSGGDAVVVEAAEREEVYRLFPRGFNLLVAGDPDGRLHVRIAGEQATALMREYQDQLERGEQPASLGDFMGGGDEWADQEGARA